MKDAFVVHKIQCLGSMLPAQIFHCRAHFSFSEDASSSGGPSRAAVDELFDAITYSEWIIHSF